MTFKWSDARRMRSMGALRSKSADDAPYHDGEAGSEEQTLLSMGSAGVETT